jgi:hypothetical protein
MKQIILSRHAPNLNKQIVNSDKVNRKILDDKRNIPFTSFINSIQ